MVIFFVRHCEAASNAEEILAGQMEFPLTERGKEQAAHIAEKFSLRVDTINYLFTSPQIRTQQTAEPFAKLLDLVPIQDPRLKEQDWGIFSGRTYQNLLNDPDFHHPNNKNWDFQPQNGESYQDVYLRVQHFFSHLLTLEPDSNLLCVTHGGTMRIIRGILEQTAPQYTPNVAANGEIWEVPSFQPNQHNHHIHVWHLGLETQHPM